MQVNNARFLWKVGLPNVFTFLRHSQLAQAVLQNQSPPGLVVFTRMPVEYNHLLQN